MPSPQGADDGPLPKRGASRTQVGAEGVAVEDIQSLITQLSLLEKAALLSGANVWQTRAIERLDIPAIWMADGPHGIRKQVGSADHLGLHGSEPATCFPTAATVASSWDEALAEEIGVALGIEAAAQEVDVLLGPGLNIKRSPLVGRAFEYFSEDPELSGRMAAAYVRGIQSQGVAATPKHFAANSQELRRMVSDSIVDERTLREIYLTAFEIVVKEAQPWAIMSAYNLINGVYAHEHAHLLQDILREEWGFDGAVISDWGGSNDAVAAVAAGGTLEMPSPGFDSAREIVTAVEHGVLRTADLDARVAEVLSLVERVRGADRVSTANLEAHHALARRAAAESAVLLKNDDALLPLAPGTSVALVGAFVNEPRYQGAGSSLVRPTQLTTLAAAAASSELMVVGTAEGFRRDGSADEDLRAEAVELARRADVVVLAMGLPEVFESEGMDRETFSVPSSQLEVLRAVHAVNPRTIVLLSAGGIVEVSSWLDHAQTLVHGYLGGQAGAEALVDLLVGDVNPAGRLAESAPVHLEDTPTAGQFPSARRTAEYREGPYVGYRYYDTASVQTAFPFGFGLSYTTFELSDLTVEKDGASVTVTNVGTRAGADVVQLYIARIDASSLIRPSKELKEFAKVRLNAGESARVRLAFNDRTFRHFDVQESTWRVEGGRYRVIVSHHAEDVGVAADIEITGTAVRARSTVLRAYRTGKVQGLSTEAFEELLGRSVPAAEWGTTELTLNDPMDRMQHAPSALARFVFRLMDRRRRKAEKRGVPDLNILFLLNGPFRVLSKMSGGRATGHLVDAVLTLVNGRTFRGFAGIVSAYLTGARLERHTARKFRALSSEKGR